jgi:gentisate 1,2-dioxygenase
MQQATFHHVLSATAVLLVPGLQIASCKHDLISAPRWFVLQDCVWTQQHAVLKCFSDVMLTCWLFQQHDAV